MGVINQFVRIDFHHFKAFSAFTLHLKHFNILVGPNNSGKSTILAAFRILAAAMRKANTRKPEIIPGPRGDTFGYVIDLNTISVAEENIFYNYDESEAATVSFELSNKNKLLLYFPEQGKCYLLVETQGKPVRTPSNFKTSCNCPIGFVPILGPVEHNEPLYEPEAARLALFNYRAARNFRNIWYHYPEKFDEFRTILAQHGPGWISSHQQLIIPTKKACYTCFALRIESKRNFLGGIWFSSMVPNAYPFNSIERYIHILD